MTIGQAGAAPPLPLGDLGGPDSIMSFDSLRWALGTAHRLSRLTGDNCTVERIRKRYYVYRTEKSGKEVNQT